MSKITVRFAGPCVKCGQLIAVGTEADWMQGVGLSHLCCPAPEPAVIQPEPEPEAAPIMHVKVSAWLARKNDISMDLEGRIVGESARAYHFIGTASTRPTISCHRCGRTLENDWSRYVGYGPICREKMHLFIEQDMVDEAEMIEAIRRQAEQRIIDMWLPKSHTHLHDMLDDSPAAVAHRLTDYLGGLTEEEARSEAERLSADSLAWFKAWIGEKGHANGLQAIFTDKCEDAE